LPLARPSMSWSKRFATRSPIRRARASAARSAAPEDRRARDPGRIRARTPPARSEAPAGPLPRPPQVAFCAPRVGSDPVPPSLEDPRASRRAIELSLDSLDLEGEIRPRAVIAMQRRIAEALSVDPRRVVVDLSAVTVLGRATIELFCAALRWLTRRGRDARDRPGAAARASHARDVRDRWGGVALERERRAGGRCSVATWCTAIESFNVQQVKGR